MLKNSLLAKLPINSLHISTQTNLRCLSCSSALLEDVPVIQFPIATKNRIIRKKLKRKNQTSTFKNLAQPGKVYISSSERSQSLFVQDYYTKFKPPVLSTQTWTSNKSPGRYLKIHAFQENPSHNTDVSFSQLLSSQRLVDSLKKINVKKPTIVQAKGIPAISQGLNTLFAAETGSGKTWTYALPILKDVLTCKSEGLEQDGPTAIVVVPTKELCTQVTRMIRSLQFDEVNVLQLTVRTKPNQDWDFEEKLPNIIVSTPASIDSAILNNLLCFDHVRYLVIDECDTLLDQSFIYDTLDVIKKFNLVDGKTQPISSQFYNDRFTQLIMCSATFPQYAIDGLQDIIDVDNLEKIRTGYLHRLPTHVTHRFLRCLPSAKMAAVVKSAGMICERGKQGIIFCNSAKSCFNVARECLLNGVSVSRLDGKMKNFERRQALEKFLSKENKILVATDVMSRGLNTPGVDHVINYEVPNQVSDYLHRCGRVGRIDSRNKNPDVTTYVSRKYEVDVMKQIENAARRRIELENVDANIKNRHEDRWRKKEQQMIESSV